MDSQQFSTQYMHYSRKLYALAFRILRRSDEAEDVVQEVYLKAWQMRDTMPDGPEAEAKLVTMTKNLSIDQLRTRHSVEEDLDQSPPPEEPDTYAEERIEQSDQLNQTFRLLNQLPELQQTILRMRLMDEMDYADIARATCLSEGNVRVQLVRARQQLKLLATKHHIL